MARMVVHHAHERGSKGGAPRFTAHRLCTALPAAGSFTAQMGPFDTAERTQ